LRFGIDIDIDIDIDIVGLHSMNDVIGLQQEMKRAALAWVSQEVRVDVVASRGL